MTKLLPILFIWLVLASCRQKKASSVPASAGKAAERASYFSKKPARYYPDFDTTKTRIDNFDSGYADTFSIAGTQFRLISNPDTSDDLEMQVLKNGEWTTNFKTFYGIDGNTHGHDINNDGFNDFQQIIRYGSYVYLYNPAAKQFTDTSIYISEEGGLIDKRKNIYYQVWQSNAPGWTSNVYQFKGLQQHFLFMLRCMESDSFMNSASHIRVYKCPTGNIEDIVFIRQEKMKTDYHDFDYKGYWQAFLRGKKYR